MQEEVKSDILIKVEQAFKDAYCTVGVEDPHSTFSSALGISRVEAKSHMYKFIYENQFYVGSMIIDQMQTITALISILKKMSGKTDAEIWQVVDEIQDGE